MHKYHYNGHIHYKDLPNLSHEGATVLIDTHAEDVYAYALGVALESGAVTNTLDITDIMRDLEANINHLWRVPPIDVLLKCTATPDNSAVIERLYWRGPHQVAWDLRGYTPGVAPIPEHVISTPELTGLLNIGGAPEAAWRCGAFWCDHEGHTCGYPRLPGIGSSEDITEDLWTFSTRDLGEEIERCAPGMNSIWETYWNRCAQSNHTILAETHSPYPHMRRYATEYRRRLGVLRRAIHSREG